MWKVVCGYDVFVEDGVIVRGMNGDGTKATYVYRKDRKGGWNKEDKITVEAFRSGVRRGTIQMN